MSAHPRLQAAGIPWYRREHYEKLLAVFEDATNLPRTFSDWLAKAEQIEQAMRQRGIRVVRVEIDPDRFPAWCTAHGLKVDANGRTRYASHIARESVTTEK